MSQLHPDAEFWLRHWSSKTILHIQGIGGIKQQPDEIVAFILDVEEACGGDDAWTTPSASSCHQLPVSGYDRKRKKREECKNRERKQESGNEEAKSQESHQVRAESNSRYDPLSIRNRMVI